LLGALVVAAMCDYGTAALAAPAPTVLFSFKNLRGANPAGGLFADHAGNLYGMTGQGGANNVGTVFELSPPVAGQTAWPETVLFSFHGPDGAHPYGALIADGAGNLYGTTNQGGANNVGAVFELSPPVAGQTAWSKTVLLTFNGTNGAYPAGALLADGAGNLYGTTEEGGANNNCGDRVGCGAVFELSPPSAGQTKWTETVLFSFHKSDGAAPLAGLIADGAGNLFGTTAVGGQSKVCGYHGCGLVFELSPPAAGARAWTETLLRSFNGIKGKAPYGGLIRDGAGNLYGTTQSGGSHGDGVAFEVTP
jgi:uncharacterized repeat protein (TIGR03803 family)